MAQSKTYKRSEIIDSHKESKLLSTVIALALEQNEKEWKIEANNPSLQTKRDPLTNQPISRISAANESTITFEQIYDYFKAGYQKERKSKSANLRILYHIDDDHHIEYRVRKDQTYPSYIISDRDYQYMNVRHTTSITDQSQNLSFKVIVRLRYDILESHPLFQPPADQCFRTKIKCRAYVCYAQENAEGTDFMICCISFTPDRGGWIPQFALKDSTPSWVMSHMNDFHKRCVSVIPYALQTRKEKVHKQMNPIEMVNDNILTAKKRNDETYSVDNIDNANVMDTMGRNDDLCLLIYDQLITMGFDAKSSRIAAQQTNDIHTAVTIASSKTEDSNDEKEENKTKKKKHNMKHQEPSSIPLDNIVSSFNDMQLCNVNVMDTMGRNDIAKKDVRKRKELLSPAQHRANQFEKFLKRNDLKRYNAKFKENECFDLEFVDIFDDDFLQNDIGINNKLLRKRFLKKCQKIKMEMNQFENEYGISALL
eukprot:271753_1